MKKIFKQLGQLIFKHRKKLIYGVFAFLISQISFFNLGGIGIENEVFAQDTSNVTSQSASSQEQATKRYEKMSFIQKVVYVLLYPLLAVAGKLADNSFVYGEIFGFDAVLWQLWNIVRNLANFALGFIFIYKIFEFLIKGQKAGDIKKLLISSLIAGVGIQASWFIMAALIDVSTILAYGVGGLPITVLKENVKGTEEESLKYNPYVLKNVIYVDVKDLDTINIYMTNTQTGNIKEGEYYISECETFSFKSDKYIEELILGPKMTYYIDKRGNQENVKQTYEDRCHFQGQVYYFSKTLVGREDRDSCKDEDSCHDLQIKYKGKLDSKKKELEGIGSGDMIKHIENAEILQVGDAHTSGGVLGMLGPVIYSSDQRYGLDLYNKWTGGSGTTARLQDIMEGKSYVGIFTALYSSLLNTGKGVVPSGGGIFTSLLRIALSLGQVLAIGIPLIAVALLFMMRIGILWMAIALSPMIILLKAFKMDESDFIKNGVFKYLKIENLLPIIFAPAIICFAISISTVLVVIISGLNLESIETAKQEVLGGLIKMDVGGLTISLGKLIISVLGIAVTRFLVWAAIGMSKLGESGIIKNLKTLAQSSLGSIPLIPVPGKGKEGVEFIGANAAFNGQRGIISNLTDKVKAEFEGRDQAALNEWLNPDQAAENAKNNRAKQKPKEINVEAYGQALISATNLGNDWTTKEIEIGDGDNKQKVTFNNLDATQKKTVIEKINDIKDEEKRAIFGNVAELKIKDGDNEQVYKFDQKNGYVIQNGSQPTT